MNSFLLWFAPFLIFFICSLSLFVLDGNKAKEEGRKQKDVVIVP